jgi:uncharacterized membrane protein (DUF2068 family)
LAKGTVRAGIGAPYRVDSRETRIVPKTATFVADSSSSAASTFPKSGATWVINAVNETKPSDPFLRVIAIFKLAKAALFFLAGIGLLHLLNKDVESGLQHLMDDLHVDHHNHFLTWCLTQAGLLTKDKKAALSAIAFFYSVLFATEGTGLYLRKRWAEWLVVILTGSLLPVEAYEIWHHVTWIKLLITAGNLLILGYLIYVIRRKKN